MDKLTFGELAIKVLRETLKPMTIEEIWEYAVEKGYDIQVEIKGKTPWQMMEAMIYVDLKDNPQTPFIRIDSNKKGQSPSIAL